MSEGSVEIRSDRYHGDHMMAQQLQRVVDHLEYYEIMGVSVKLFLEDGGKPTYTLGEDFTRENIGECPSTGATRVDIGGSYNEGGCLMEFDVDRGVWLRYSTDEEVSAEEIMIVREVMPGD